MAEEPTKLYQYCQRLYERMDSEATDEEEMRVWRGRIIATCIDVGIPEGSYSKVVTKLRSVGSIEQVSRGFRGSALATFILHHPPTPERLERESDLTSAPNYDRLASQVEDLKRQIGGINLVKVLHNLEQRLQQVERKTRKL